MARLPVLMYHHISAEKARGLTIGVETLERQLYYLFENGFRTYHFHELRSIRRFPSNKNIVITFDDAYVSQMELAVPLLKKYGLKASIFVPLDFLGKVDSWNTSSLKIMDIDQLKSLDPELIELGYHSFYHQRYDKLSNAEIEADMRRCLELVSENELNLSPVLAYPYGKFPKDKTRNDIFEKILSQNNIEFGLRIGNRINRFPFKDPYKIERIDVKGQFTSLKFRQKIRFGKFF